MRDEHPGDWAKAIALDCEIREHDSRGGVFLSDQRVPLDQAEIDGAVEATEQPNLFSGCESGYCWV
jgi:hypothetical protein